MGFKLASIFINSETPIELKDLKSLGFDNDWSDLVQNEYSETINPEYDSIYIGNFENKIVINSWELAASMFEIAPSKMELAIIHNYPTSQIIAICIHQGLGIYGFSIIQNGIRKRVFFNDNQSKNRSFEIGDPLNYKWDQSNKDSSSLPTEIISDLLKFSKIDEFGFPKLKMLGFKKIIKQKNHLPNNKINRVKDQFKSLYQKIIPILISTLLFAQAKIQIDLNLGLGPFVSNFFNNTLGCNNLFLNLFGILLLEGILLLVCLFLYNSLRKK